MDDSSSPSLPEEGAMSDSDIMGAFAHILTDPRARDSMGMNALMNAAGNGSLEQVDMLIRHGADLNAVDNAGNTALGIAAHFGHDDVVAHLIEKKADVNLGMPLVHSVIRRNWSIAKALVAHGADVNKSDGRGQTPLMSAAFHGQTEMVEYLLENEADVGATSVDGKQALLLAAVAGHSECVRLLIERSKPLPPNFFKIHIQELSHDTVAKYDALVRLKERRAKAKRDNEGDKLQLGGVSDEAVKAADDAMESLLREEGLEKTIQQEKKKKNKKKSKKGVFVDNDKFHLEGCDCFVCGMGGLEV